MAEAKVITEPAGPLSCVQTREGPELEHSHRLLCFRGQRAVLSLQVPHCQHGPEGCPPPGTERSGPCTGAQASSSRADGRLPPDTVAATQRCHPRAQTPSGHTLGSESTLPRCEFHFHHFLTSSRSLTHLCLSFFINNKAT